MNRKILDKMMMNKIKIKKTNPNIHIQIPQIENININVGNVYFHVRKYKSGKNGGA